MKKLQRILASLLLAFLASCASTPLTISGAPAGGLPIPVGAVPGLATDLQSAAFNLDQAVLVGALPANDPAPACLHDVLIKAGVELAPGATPAKSFTPKYDGIASTGAVAYILARQAQALAIAGGIAVAASCEQLVGRVVIDGAKNINKVGVSLIPGLLK